MKKSLTLLALLASAAPVSPLLAQSTDAPFTTGSRYDAMRRLTGTISPDPDGAGPLRFAAVRNTYDNAGRLTRVEKGELAAWQPETVAPAQWSGFTILQTIDMKYDALDRKISEKVSAAGAALTFAQTSYDLAGRVRCTAVRMNIAAFDSSPDSACTQRSSDGLPPDRIVSNTYNAAGDLQQVREGVGTGDEAAEATYSYTASGKREFLIDGKGHRSAYGYDGHDRLTSLTFPSESEPAGYNDATPDTALASAGAANPADVELFGYDANGNRTSFTNRAHEAIAYGFDARNRMQLKDRPASEQDIVYTYDNRGLQLTAIYSGSADGITNDFDNAGRLVSTASAAGGVTRTLAYGWDADGNRESMTYPDGFVVTYVNDGVGRVEKIREGTTSVLATYTYDPLGRRSSITRGNGTTTSYQYDGVSRLHILGQRLPVAGNDVDFTLDYNPASQIETRSASNDAFALPAPPTGATGYQANGRNQMIQAGGTTVGWDAKGNLTSDGTNTYGYSAENLLATIANPTGRYQTAAALSYDPVGRLREIGSNYSGYWAQLVEDPAGQVVVEYGTQSRVRRYVFGPGVDEPLVQYFVSPTFQSRTWYQADERGSIILQSGDNGSGGFNRYDEYGAPGSSNTGRFQYTGQYWLAEPSLYYYKARFYDPQLGVFLQSDPQGYAAGTNLYGYVDEDPINKTDSTGLCAEDACVVEGSVMLVALGAAAVCQATGACPRFANAVHLVADRFVSGVKDRLYSDGSKGRPSDSKPIRTGATVSRPGRRNVDAIFTKPGGANAADRDFDRNVDPRTVVDRGGGVRTGQTPGGQNITVRPDSKAGPATVEITTGNGKERKTDKFRYPE